MTSDSKGLFSQEKCVHYNDKGCPYADAIEQGQRLQSLGLMSAEIVHDLSNLFSVVLGHAELSHGLIENNAELCTRLLDIQNAALNGGGLCKDILTYAGKKKTVLAPLDPGELVRDLQSFLRIIIPKQVSFVEHLDPSLPALLGDPCHLRQIIMNLLINATEAIGNARGRIILSVSRCHSETNTVSPLAPCGTYVKICVEDNGCGMNDEVKARMCEPFYTTKLTGRGLGMASVQKILHDMGGTMRVDSEVGKGTAITVVIPAFSAIEGVDPVPCVAAEGAAPIVLTGTVLLVDDELQLRKVGADLLRRMGLTVLTASDGVEAVSCFREHAATIDVTIMDSVMPQMNGCEALRAIRTIAPSARVIILSGYSDIDLSEKLKGEAPDEMLLKPVDSEALRQAVWRCIHRVDRIL